MSGKSGIDRRSKCHGDNKQLAQGHRLIGGQESKSVISNGGLITKSECAARITLKITEYGMNNNLFPDIITDILKTKNY